MSIFGRRFLPGTTVNFGTKSATVVSIASDLVVVKTAANTVGNQNVIITAPGQAATTLTLGFTYY